MNLKIYYRGKGTQKARIKTKITTKLTIGVSTEKEKISSKKRYIYLPKINPLYPS